MENEGFVYRYSADNSCEAERIKKRYLPKEETKMERLRRLDRRAQNAGRLPSIIVGILGCLVFGVGMCFGLDVFGGDDWLTVLFCGLGILIMAPVYPLYKRASERTRDTLAPEIIRLSDEIIGEG